MGEGDGVVEVDAAAGGAAEAGDNGAVVKTTRNGEIRLTLKFLRRCFSGGEDKGGGGVPGGKGMSAMFSASELESAVDVDG